jgi:hypothetical protein
MKPGAVLFIKFHAKTTQGLGEWKRLAKLPVFLAFFLDYFERAR